MKITSSNEQNSSPVHISPECYPNIVTCQISFLISIFMTILVENEACDRLCVSLSHILYYNSTFLQRGIATTRVLSLKLSIELLNVLVIVDECIDSKPTSRNLEWCCSIRSASTKVVASVNDGRKRYSTICLNSRKTSHRESPCGMNFPIMKGNSLSRHHTWEAVCRIFTVPFSINIADGLFFASILLQKEVRIP